MKNYAVALIISLAGIACFWIAANAVTYKFRNAETITVTGLAEKDFSSDQIAWSATYSRKSMDLKSAYAMLKADENSVKNYLHQKGVIDSEMVFNSIDINKEFSNRYDENGRQLSSEFTGYNLTQVVNVETKDIPKIEKLSREITELIQGGIELNSSQPSYYYTRLSELKIDLLAKASADAKLRAETIAKNSGSSLGGIKKATMGVFQITGQNSNEDYSSGGVFNTSSKNKTASITMKIEYAVK